MAKEFSNIITLMEIGKSFEGRPLYVLKVGDYLYIYMPLGRLFFIIIGASPKCNGSQRIQRIQGI